jgi:uncharacterized protein YfdQ (DUF2303 family)
MSIDNVQAIIELTQAADESVQPKGTDFPVMTVPPGFALKGLEEFNAFRNQYRADFSTIMIDDFAMYYNNLLPKSGDAAASDQAILPTIYMDPEELSAAVVFDSGTLVKPGKCKHAAEVKLRKTEPYKELLALSHTEFTQNSLFNFLQDWKMNITVYADNGDEIPHAVACQRILHIDIKEKMESSHIITDMSQHKSASAQIEAKSGNNESLPAMLLFDCKPYAALSSYQFPLRISMKADRSETPRLQLRCDGLEATKIEMINEFAELLRGKFADDRVLLGNISF